MHKATKGGRRAVLAVLLAGLTAAAAQAENLLFNSGFELGDAGYACVKYLRPDTNPEMKYEGPAADATTFVSGRQSLRVPDRFAEQVRLVAAELKLAPDTDYTLSFWAKSAAENGSLTASAISASAEKSVGWDVKERKFALGTQWRRYELDFHTQPNRKLPYYTVSFDYGHEKGAPAADLWLDDLQLDVGSLQDYRPAAPVEVAAVPGQRLYVNDGGGASAAVNVVAVNHSTKGVKVGIDLELAADNSGWFPEGLPGEATTVPVGPVELAAGERKVIPVNVPLGKFGAYYVRPKVGGEAASRAQDGYVAVVGKYEGKPLDLDREFCVGVNLGSGGFMAAPRNNELEKPAFRMAGCSPDEFMELLSKMGCRLVRDWDYPAPALHWRIVEPEEGKYDFSIADRMLAGAAKYGIAVMPVLGESDLITTSGAERPTMVGLPDWLIRKSTQVEKTRDFIKRDGNQVYLPPMDSWRSLVRAVARHCQGKVTHYEIMNEPNLYLEAEPYLGYLKTAFDEIKAADPAARVVGFCSTGDLGGNVAGFVDGCFQGGGLKYADIVSIHPYDAPNLGAATPADKQVAAVRKLIGKYGDPAFPLWNTELYYLTGKGSNYVEKGYFRPQDAAQRFLTDLGEGMGQSVCSPAEYTLFKSLTPHNLADSPRSLNAFAPNSNYVAYNALARLFEGAKPADKIGWGSDTACYVYERAGKYLAAFWYYGEAQGPKLRLAFADSQATLYDVYGNPVPLGTPPLELSAAPYYLAWNGKDREAFIAGLKAAGLETDKPVVAGSLRLLPEGDGWKAVVGLRNCTGQEIRGKLGVRGGGILAPASVDFVLPANAEQSVEVPVKKAGAADGPAEVIIYAAEKIWRFPVPVMAKARVYPAGSGEGKAEALAKSSQGKPAGKASFSARYDERNLYVTVRVRDRSPSGAAGGRRPWEQDCVELFFDARPGFLPTKDPAAYHGGVGRLFVTPHAAPRLTVWPGELKRLAPENIALRVEVTPDGYTVGVTIPLEALDLASPARGRSIGFDIAVDDADGPGKAGTVLNWNSPGQAHQDRCSFGFIEFV